MGRMRCGPDGAARPVTLAATFDTGAARVVPGSATAIGRRMMATTRTRMRPKPQRTKPTATGLFTFPPTRANFAALTPVTFLTRAAAVHPDRVAAIHGEHRITYRQLEDRARRLASGLARRGIRPGQTVSAMLPNVPAMLDAHFGVPMLGAVLNTINTRLDARTVAYILDHGEAKALITDREYAAAVGPALRRLKRRPLVIDVDDPLYEGPGERLGNVEYEAFLSEGSPDFAWTPPASERQAIALNYTSGTTGNPKGVVYSHRGAFLEALGNVLAWPVSPRPVYLWTLPLVFRLIAEHGVTHMCGAPTVLAMLINAPVEQRVKFDHVVEIETGGSSPPAKVIKAMSELGFRVTHLYGLTEVHGPSTLCVWQEAWDALGPAQQAAMVARQGVPYPTLAGQMVADAKTLEPVPADGRTIGEVMLRGSTVMLGYLKDKAATAAAFRGGWFHSGDLAVQHPDGYIEIKDRLKDIIISGGENISSIEVEIALTRHPAVLMAAVVARPDEKWGETPCAFVQLKPDTKATEEELIAFCRDQLPRSAVPKTVVFGPLPTTATGKIQKYTLRERTREL